ncbi:MAG TPA: hypothetical protein VHU40_06860 [Polyangia bacterium]|nr:hypothetical protein [Polyangia bacterium]
MRGITQGTGPRIALRLAALPLLLSCAHAIGKKVTVASHELTCGRDSDCVISDRDPSEGCCPKCPVQPYAVAKRVEQVHRDRCDGTECTLEACEVPGIDPRTAYDAVCVSHACKRERR